MDLSCLDALESRLKYLEDLLDPPGADTENDTEKSEDIGKQLSLISNMLKNEKVSSILKKAEEIQKFTDSADGEEDSLIPISVKREIIISKTEDFQQAGSLLQKLQELEPLLDSKPIQDVSGHEIILNKMMSQHSLHEEKFQKLAEQVVAIVKKYDDLVNHVSGTLEELEAKVAKLETAASKSSN